MDSGVRGLDQQRHLVQQKINQLELKFKEGTKREAHVMRELPVNASTVSVRGSSNFKGKGSIMRGNNTSSVVVVVGEKSTPAIRKNKKKELEALVQELKKQGKEGQRFCVEEELKAKIWGEVEVRVRQSDKEYRDPMHRNHKHEFEHLMNTF